MFLLDSLMISGIRWALQTLATAAESKMNDDAALREQLLEAEMRREMGELSDAEFRQTEAALLARIREIRERRDGGSGPLGFEPLASGDRDGERLRVEASMTGEFHQPAAEATQRRPALAAQARLGPARKFRLKPEPTFESKPEPTSGPTASRARKRRP